MMSFFKKETKEDKERKKLEKKLHKEAKIQQQQQQQQSQIILNSNVNLSNINNSNNSKTNSLDLSDIDNAMHYASNNLNNNNGGGGNDTMSSTSSTIANLITKFDSTQSQLNAPPRPKKGILKGMTKFSSSTSSSSPPSTPSSSQQQYNQSLIISNTLIESSIKQTKQQASSQQQQQSLVIDSINLNLPDIKKTKDEHSIRELIINTNLDKLNIYEKNSLFYIETQQQQQQQSQTMDCLLLPGDVLVSINGLSCKELSLQQIKHQIQQHVNLNKPLQLKVKTSPESLEFIMRNTLDNIKIPDTYLNNGTLRRVGSLRHKSVVNPNYHHQQQQNSPTSSSSPHQMVTSTSSLSSSNSLTSSNSSSTSINNTYADDHVWLVHTNGYSSAKIVSKLNDTINGTNDIKYKIKLDNGSIIEVNEDIIEKANPSKFDRIEDLSNLRFINETSIIHTIRQRYGSSLIHTYAGQNLLIVKPLNTLSIYNDKVISMFKGCKQEDMPPHIYSYTQSIYRNMLSNRLDHSIILMGHSGSGK